MIITGVLCSVDRYLNIKIKEAKLKAFFDGLKVFSVCSIRGSAIKVIDIDRKV